MPSRLGKIIIFSAPSGAGKTTLIKGVRLRLPNLHFSVSTTTRLPREGEVNGREYHFISNSEFDALIKQDQFLEYADVHKRKYGTLRKETERLLQIGIDVIVDIDVQGGEKILLNSVWNTIAQPEIITIFIEPPSMESLRKRLLSRPGETNDLDIRLANAQSEMDVGRRLYTYHVINKDGDDGIKCATEDIIEILQSNDVC